MKIQRLWNVVSEIGPTIRHAGLGSIVPRFRTVMPGQSYRGSLPPLGPDELTLAGELRSDVTFLATEPGERNIFNPPGLASSEDFLVRSLRSAGLEVTRQTFDVRGVPCSNCVAEIRGRTRPDEIVVVGAHYDSVHLGGGVVCPAANDNASGVTATLALARRFAGETAPDRTVRFVLFVNEEPPFFWTRDMGSLVYAAECRRRNDNIVGMITPETIGCFSDEPGSQRYPFPMSRYYPSTGDFVAFVGMFQAFDFIARCVEIFRRSCQFPCEGAALPPIIPRAGASDHWSFWKQGYPALMVTDTAPYRYKHYHKPTDTPDRLDYERMARVVGGLESVVRDLAGAATGL